MATISSPFVNEVEYEEPNSPVPTRHRMTALAGAENSILAQQARENARKEREQNRPDRPPGLLVGVLGIYVLYRLLT